MTLTPATGLRQLLGLLAFYLVLTPASVWLMPRLAGAPSWRDDPMWYLSAWSIGLVFLVLLHRQQRRRERR